MCYKGRARRNADRYPSPAKREPPADSPWGKAEDISAGIKVAEKTALGHHVLPTWGGYTAASQSAALPLGSPTAPPGASLGNGWDFEKQRNFNKQEAIS